MVHVGGIVGFGNGVVIKNVYNRGSIYGKSRVGGIIGYVSENSGISGTDKNYIYNCFNATEDIKGDSSVGNFGGETGKVTGRYNSSITDKTILGADNNSSWSDYESYTLTQMKTNGSGLLTLMLKGEGNELWAQSSTINNGLPYLVNCRP